MERCTVRRIASRTSNGPSATTAPSAGPINTVAEVVADPQLQARGMIADHWDERIGRNVKGPGVVPVLSESPGTIRNAGSARPGQHNDEVYRDLLGRSDAELAALKEAGVI